MINKSINSNYIKDGKTLIGKLYFETESFCFKAQSANGDINYGDVKYNQIARVELKNSFGFIPNGLLVVLKDKTEMMFIPMKRKQVKGFLVSKITK